MALQGSVLLPALLPVFTRAHQLTCCHRHPPLMQRLAAQDPSRPPLLPGLARALSMPTAAAQRRSPPIPQFGTRHAAPHAAPQGGWLAQEQMRLLPRAAAAHGPLPQARPQIRAEVATFAASQQLDVLAGPFDSDPPLLRCMGFSLLLAAVKHTCMWLPVILACACKPRDALPFSLVTRSPPCPPSPACSDPSLAAMLFGMPLPSPKALPVDIATESCLLPDVSSRIGCVEWPDVQLLSGCWRGGFWRGGLAHQC